MPQPLGAGAASGFPARSFSITRPRSLRSSNVGSSSGVDDHPSPAGRERRAQQAVGHDHAHQARGTAEGSRRWLVMPRGTKAMECPSKRYETRDHVVVPLKAGERGRCGVHQRKKCPLRIDAPETPPVRRQIEEDIRERRVGNPDCGVAHQHDRS